MSENHWSICYHRVLIYFIYPIFRFSNDMNDFQMNVLRKWKTKHLCLTVLLEKYRECRVLRIFTGSSRMRTCEGNIPVTHWQGKRRRQIYKLVRHEIPTKISSKVYFRVLLQILEDWQKSRVMIKSQSRLRCHLSSVWKGERNTSKHICPVY